MQDKVNIEEKFRLVDVYWTPKILGQVNESHVKIFKAKGEFVWHSHEEEEEFFLVIKGQLTIKMPDREVVIHPGEFFIVPKGVEHLPYAKEETHVLLFEPKNVINTGNVTSKETVSDPDWI